MKRLNFEIKNANPEKGYYLVADHDVKIGDNNSHQLQKGEATGIYNVPRNVLEDAIENNNLSCYVDPTSKLTGDKLPIDTLITDHSNVEYCQLQQSKVKNSHMSYTNGEGVIENSNIINQTPDNPLELNMSDVINSVIDLSEQTSGKKHINSGIYNSSIVTSSNGECNIDTSMLNNTHIRGSIEMDRVFTMSQGNQPNFVRLINNAKITGQDLSKFGTIAINVNGDSKLELLDDVTPGTPESGQSIKYLNDQDMREIGVDKLEFNAKDGLDGVNHIWDKAEQYLQAQKEGQVLGDNLADSFEELSKQSQNAELEQ